jgi:NADH:ubiquinone oxidoreductase subunit F (NADH-binding)
VTTVTASTTDRLLTGPSDATTGLDLAAHVALHGALPPAIYRAPGAMERIVEDVARSGLVGRGGGGYPTSAKWDSVRRQRRQPVLVVNAMEGEPDSAKDRVLLICSPHLVLDGAEVAAAAVGASEIVICVADHSPRAAAWIESAVTGRDRAGASMPRATVQRPPGRYVTGEESALVNWLASRKALPTFRPDKGVPLTWSGRPVLVHNPETLAMVALIARHGAEWFRQLGTPEAPGTTLVTVTGAVRHPGVLEVELGTPVGDILGRAGGHAELSAALLGGCGGAWLDASLLGVSYAPGPLAAVGATQGVGVVTALPVTSCGIAETARIVRYLAGQSAGQCGPCAFGLPAMAADLEELWGGHANGTILDRVTRRASVIGGRGACRHPDGATRLVMSALSVFADDARAHAEGRPCAGRARPTVLGLPGDQGTDLVPR